MIQVPRKIFSITELFQNLPNVIPQIHSPSIQMLPIVFAYFTTNSENKENPHFVRNGSIGDICYCQAINEKTVMTFKNVDEQKNHPI